MHAIKSFLFQQPEEEFMVCIFINYYLSGCGAVNFVYNCIKSSLDLKPMSSYKILHAFCPIPSTYCQFGKAKTKEIVLLYCSHLFRENSIRKVRDVEFCTSHFQVCFFKVWSNDWKFINIAILPFLSGRS
ncbi:Uncharacterized protein TCM_034551 [Theobroma cacao]|uniref:Uncharacterized protein n=1 Tax=Theobroma cacao TaxID=3641 RepID=A0A061FLZ0_THECC|nr:Uncharacterized protein TCM_034551 [Theobroma cacao]